VPPEWAMIAAIAILFTWGFSKRKGSDADTEVAIETSTALEEPQEATSEVP